MSLWILQLSDLHFGQMNPPIPAALALAPLVATVEREVAQSPAPLVAAICGDVVDRGDQRHYDTAARTLEVELLKPLGWPSVVCCPGNHDVVAGENGLFTGFNTFAFRVTNKAGISFTPDATVVTLTLNGFRFVLANSMYRGYEDRSQGEVNIDHLDRAMGTLTDDTTILVVHHSLIPNRRSETSTLVNSYPLLQLAVARRVALILHGHLHAQNVLTVGKAGTAALGVGSLLYRPSPNYNNGFNLLRVDGSALAVAYAFRFVADASEGGLVGTFQKTMLEVL